MEPITILFLGGLAIFLIYTVFDIVSNTKESLEMKKKAIGITKALFLVEAVGTGRIPRKKTHWGNITGSQGATVGARNITDGTYQKSAVGNMRPLQNVFQEWEVGKPGNAGPC